MLSDWLEPVIEKRCDEINGIMLETGIGSEYEVFLNILRINTALSNEEKFDLENAFILHSKRVVEISYRSGLTEGIQIYRKDG
ncbi:hypothetical protein [Paenibacillus sp.]|jgi:hypothetical protein|uniref:hypothetical protein n=1 Tax=Paenibacillus sp. TaxID=58172 RepID=UPI002817F49B|nr:hypothetical protein [Paenibacillus sp.]MDR0266683.1 hypothetical protein [Paenibacillus sp.]